MVNELTHQIDILNKINDYIHWLLLSVIELHTKNNIVFAECDNAIVTYIDGDVKVISYDDLYSIDYSDLLPESLLSKIKTSRLSDLVSVDKTKVTDESKLATIIEILYKGIGWVSYDSMITVFKEKGYLIEDSVLSGAILEVLIDRDVVNGVTMFKF